MELNIKFNEKMLAEMANRVLDEYEYNGKTIREWADLIANPKTNADRIRSMTDEELLKFIQMVHGNGRVGLSPTNGWEEWLKKPNSFDESEEGE